MSNSPSLCHSETDLLNALFSRTDDDICYEADGERGFASGPEDFERFSGRIAVSPLLKSGVVFLFGVMHGANWEDYLDCEIAPTAALFKDDTLIVLWALDVAADPTEAAHVADALGMEGFSEFVPVPPTGGWEIVHLCADTFTTLGKLAAAYCNLDVPAEETTYGHARILSPYNENDYQDLITITGATRTDSKDWKPGTMTTAKFIASLCVHRVGKKDGPSFVLADMVPGQRLKNSVKSLSAIGLDIDTGTPSEVVDAALLKLGCVAVRYTTHSHGKTKTEFKKDRITKFAGDREIDTDLIREFLRSEEQWDETMVESAEFDDIIHTDKGIMAVVTHKPMPKHRIVVFPKEPFDIASEAKTQVEAMKKWAEVPKALAALLNVTFDKSCTDPSRLFFFPRHDKDRPFEISLFGGAYFDWRSLELGDPLEKLAAEVNKGSSKSVTAEGKELGRWSMKRGHGFQIADVLDDHAPDRIRGKATQGYDIECPFDELHSNTGDPADRACFVVNAGEGSSEFFTISCRHEGCRDKTMLDMLGKMIKDGWFDKSVLEDETYNALAPEDEEAETKASKSAETHRMVQDQIALLKPKSDASSIGGVIAGIAKLTDTIVVEQELMSLSEATNLPIRALRKELKTVKHSIGRTSPEGSHPHSTVEIKLPDQATAVRIETVFPVPNAGFGKFEYRMFEGRPWLYRVDDEENPDAGDTSGRLVTPLTIAAGVIFPDRAGVRGLRVEILNEDGNRSSLDLQSGLAVQSYGVGLKVKLREAGVAFTDEGERFLISQFKQVTPGNPTEVYDRPGWHGDAFLTAWGRVINSNRPIELSVDNHPKGQEVAGNLECWIGATEAAFVSGVLSFQIGALTGFASVLLDLLGYPSMCVAFTGMSTQGKSTGQRLGAAVWGDSKQKEGLFGTFDGTIRASEALLQRASGNFWSFDEAHMIDGGDLQTLIYKMSSNSGADRLNRNADLRQARKWTVFMVISGEKSLSEKIKQSGDNAATGLTTRVLEINVDDQAELSVEAMARIEAAYSNHGHAGPVFVRQVAAMGYVKDRDRARDEIESLAHILAGADAAPPLRRSARIVAVLWQAGIIADAAGLIPSHVDLEQVVQRLWVKAQEAEIAASKPVSQAILALFETLITRLGGDVAIGSSGQNRNALAYRLGRFKDNADVFVVPIANLAKLSGGAIGEKTLSRELAKREMLLLPPRRDRKSNAWDFVPGLGRIRSIIIPASVVEDDRNEDLNETRTANNA